MGWVVFIVIVIIAWGIAGAILPPSGSNGLPSGTSCDACKELNNWWSGLSRLQKVREAVNYNWKRVECITKGCPV